MLITYLASSNMFNNRAVIDLNWFTSLITENWFINKPTLVCVIELFRRKFAHVNYPEFVNFQTSKNSYSRTFFLKKFRAQGINILPTVFS